MTDSIKRTAQTAFTLVEISVVLVIIGLLVGGVLVGTSLLKQAELQTVVSDYTKYTNAYNQFVQQYGGIPGDILDATNFFGKDNTYCSGDTAAAATPGTCNGDNNGQIATANALGSLFCHRAERTARAWQHLQLSGLLKANFSGVPASTGGSDVTLGTNAPRSRISNSGWAFSYKGATSGNSTWYNADIGNFLMFGSPLSGAFTRGAALTASQAWQIDKKTDDSRPAFGRVVAVKPAALLGCTTSSTDATAEYDTNGAGTTCNLNMSVTTK